MNLGSIAAWAAGSLVCLCSVVADASVTVYTSKADFDAAAGPTSVENFTSAISVSTDATSATYEYGDFVGTTEYTNTVDACCGQRAGVWRGQPKGYPKPGDVFVFDANINAWGALLNTQEGGDGRGIDVRIELVSGFTVVGSVGLPGYPNNGFLGFISDEPFDTVRINYAVDNDGGKDTYSLDNLQYRFAPTNQAPVADAGGQYSGNEGSAIAINATASSDPDDDPLTYLWSITGDPCTFDDPTAATTSVTCPDGPASYMLSLTVSDGTDTSSDSVTLQIDNVAPTVAIDTPIEGQLFAVTDVVGFSASFTDPAGAGDESYECTISWGDGGPDGGGNLGYGSSCTGSHEYSEAGVYTVAVTVEDKDAGQGYAETFIIVYDPSGGFVTGGGWIESPEGAYPADPSLVGKASFGFVSKYKKGATVPTGNTQFVFQAGGLVFHSTGYDWLVVAGGNKAQYKGTGTINGFGNYGFLIFATDADATSDPDDADSFRIQIWDKDNGDAPVYDNGAEQQLGGGSIVVHTGGKKR